MSNIIIPNSNIINSLYHESSDDDFADIGYNVNTQETNETQKKTESVSKILAFYHDIEPSDLQQAVEQLQQDLEQPQPPVVPQAAAEQPPAVVVVRQNSVKQPTWISKLLSKLRSVLSIFCPSSTAASSYFISHR